MQPRNRDQRSIEAQQVWIEPEWLALLCGHDARNIPERPSKRKRIEELKNRRKALARRSYAMTSSATRSAATRPHNRATSASPKSKAVPAPREVMISPSSTTRSSKPPPSSSRTE